MKEKEKKSNSKNYLVQGSILAVASIIAKIIGMIYRFPLTNTLGNEEIIKTMLYTSFAVE